MFDWVHIAKMPERDIKSFNASFHEGLQGYSFFGYLFMIGSIIFLIIALMKIRMIFPYIGISILFGIGYLFYNKAKTTANKRLECFLKGHLVTSVVIDHSRTFNPFSSTRKYAITLKTEDQKKITVEHKSEELWTKFPKNQTVLGLEYNGNYLFGPEMGIDFKLFANQ